MNCTANKFLGGLILFMASWLSGESLETVYAQQQVKLEATLKRLQDQRAAIQAKQVPMTRQLRGLEAESGQLRRELQQARKAEDSRHLSMERLRSQLDAVQKESAYIGGVLLGDYVSRYHANLSLGELHQQGAELTDHNLLMEDAQADPAAKLQSALQILKTSVQHMQTRLGGQFYAGEALDLQGHLITGEFVQVGPLLYFSGATSGVVQASQSLHARVHPIDSNDTAAIESLVRTGEGLLPMDLSLGNAIALSGARDSLLQHLKKGGVWVYPILLFALVATIAALFKSLQVLRIRQPASNTIYKLSTLLRSGQRAEALQLAQQQPEPARTLLVQAVEHSEESIDLVEEVMYESMLSTQPRLERYLNIIAVTASVAPLLGLLGTVTGIIKTFNLMRIFGAGDPKPLISGISEALITTEIGLVLAIPALVIHALLSRKVSGVMAHLEKLSMALLNSLSRQDKGSV
jgi:biopolymer transport protein ExbB